MICSDPTFPEFNETSTDLSSSAAIDYAAAADPVMLNGVLAASPTGDFL
jgi:hypothetical protein